MWNSQTVSVVLPAYNEEEGIAGRSWASYESRFVDEVIVVNNNSRDGTVAEASARGRAWSWMRRGGYGAAGRVA